MSCYCHTYNVLCPVVHMSHRQCVMSHIVKHTFPSKANMKFNLSLKYVMGNSSPSNNNNNKTTLI